jgi:hypothetical protein
VGWGGARAAAPRREAAPWPSAAARTPPPSRAAPSLPPGGTHTLRGAGRPPTAPHWHPPAAPPPSPNRSAPTGAPQSSNRRDGASSAGSPASERTRRPCHPPATRRSPGVAAPGARTAQQTVQVQVHVHRGLNRPRAGAAVLQPTGRCLGRAVRAACPRWCGLAAPRTLVCGRATGYWLPRRKRKVDIVQPTTHA